MFYDDPASYKSLLPDRFQDVIEINVLDKTINIQIDKLSKKIKDAIGDKSIACATEQGIARWEKILGVTTPLNSTLQARREALKSKLMTKPPINLKVLKGIVEAYMGLEVDVTVVGFIIKIRYRGISRIADLNPLYATAYETIPANMLMEIAYAYLTWGETNKQTLTWGETTALGLTWGAWQRGEWIG